MTKSAGECPCFESFRVNFKVIFFQRYYVQVGTGVDSYSNLIILRLFRQYSTKAKPLETDLCD